MITIVEAYIAFAIAFGLALGAEGFPKRHILAEILQFSGGFGFVLIPLWHLSEGLHVFDVWWIYLIKPFYGLVLLGAIFGVTYNWFRHR